MLRANKGKQGETQAKDDEKQYEALPSYEKQNKSSRRWLNIGIYPYEAIIVVIFVMAPVIGLAFYIINEGNNSIRNTLSNTYKDLSSEIVNSIIQCINSVETMHNIQTAFITVDDTFITATDKDIIHREALRYSNTLNAYARSSGMYAIRINGTFRGVLKTDSGLFFSDTLDNDSVCQYVVKLPGTIIEEPVLCFERGAANGVNFKTERFRLAQWSASNTTGIRNTYLIRSGIFDKDMNLRFIFSSNIIPADFKAFLSHLNTKNDDFFIIDTNLNYLVTSTLNVTVVNPTNNATAVFDIDTFVSLSNVRSPRIRSVQKKVNEMFGSWKNVTSSRYWDGDTIVNFEIINKTNGISWVLVTIHECDWTDMGVKTMILVFVIVILAIVILALFVVLMSYSIRYISKEMRVVATLDLTAYSEELDPLFSSSSSSSGSDSDRSDSDDSNNDGKTKKANKDRTKRKKRRNKRGLCSVHNLSVSLPDIRELHEGTQKLRLCAMAMKKYISPFLTRDIIERDPEAPPIKKNITVMFVSLTGISEFEGHQHKSRVQAILNAFYKNFGQAIIDYNGVIDKYINGSIMVLFGLNSSDDNTEICNEYNGCLAAFKFNTAMEITNAEIHDSEVELSYKVGMDCGDAYCGNIGYESRASYTAYGPPVSVAGQLERLTEIYGLSPLVSENITRKVNGKFHCILLDSIYVKGNKGRTKIYHLLGKKDDRAALTERKFHKIHRYIRRGQLGEAIKLIRHIYCDEKYEIYKRSLKILKKHIELEGNFYYNTATP